MRRSSDNRSQLTSFLVGVAFCFMGMLFLIYLAKDIVIDAIRETKAPDQVTKSPIPEDGDSPLPSMPTAIDPNGQIQLPDGSMAQNLPSDQPLPPKPHSGRLDDVHGQGGRDHLRAVPNQFTNKEEWVHHNVYPALMTLISAAKQDGIDLSIVSAYRSYAHQRRIWENKWGSASDTDIEKARQILRYSSFPGTSRHHWGTDIDFNSVTLDYWNSPKGRNTYRWLTNNAPKFGFCQVYASGRNKGYSDEPWHWSHTPTANYYYHQISTMPVLQTALAQPLKGAAAVRQIPEHMMGYITGVSSCRVSAQPAHITRPATTQTVSQKGSIKNKSQSQLVNNNLSDSFVDTELDELKSPRANKKPLNNNELPMANEPVFIETKQAPTSDSEQKNAKASIGWVDNNKTQ
ncbi:M15 family metallopeptidase [Psychrobacter ciconiae]|uniref:M15 family metallopeptidase n=1 Tax=Psychrobacter ciconiae TaxID=1553449 RepID=UPI001917FE5E|nr:M15 family metallopeptidase [Psychrobacter ciconiae]